MLPTQTSEVFRIYEDEGSRYVFCPIRRRVYKVDNKPEEIVRQKCLYKLRDMYGYSFDQISVEVPVKVGSTIAKKRADIVVYTNSKKNTPRIFIENKKPHRKDGVDQLQVYMNATGCRLGMWSNGTEADVYLLRIEPSATHEEPRWRELRNIPAKNEQITDVDSPLTRSDLIPIENMLGLLKESEDFIKAHEGTDPFNEFFKLIFAKLYDERRNLKNNQSVAKFRAGVTESVATIRARIDELFDDAQRLWNGVFLPGEHIELGNESLAYCVSALQRYYLLKSEADVLGSAFEVMVNPSMKGDKGQYFTPRHVIDLCVKVIDPKETETVLDPACGSGGFLIGAIGHVFREIREERDDESEILENQKDYAAANVFGIDYDPLIAKVAKAYMLIWGDGRSNVCVADSLNPQSWPEEVKSKFTKLDDHKKTIYDSDGQPKLRQFDCVLMNPPFAGAVSANDILANFELGYTKNTAGKRKLQNTVNRILLFIELGIKMLSPNGRMAIVVPRGILKNYGAEPVRDYILRQCKCMAVVGLSSQMFKPFTNTKTCILFLQKRKKPLGAVTDFKSDPNVVFAVTQRPGKDRSGNIVRRTDGTVDTDLEEIADYLTNNIRWAGENDAL
ncbi:N-6 DNA methylase [Bifidobacterium crudilactis]|jgi:type I restriction enzyme M protein|uniref:N-6 DNA methylase n=1 Tax=Bifidobacterium crudilactis TaxID=327277 RepID=UPI0023530408|nr:N-6 DNA methylase [Bifidobacterium crudilactis]MCI1218557.1 N-6 DNA methylase [Bifidobacterium crudilactis]